MAEELKLTPPNDPPDAPELETQPEPKVEPKPETPVFTEAQAKAMVAETIRSTFKEVFPSPRTTTTVDSPSGPSPLELQKEIDDIDNQIDLAVQEGKPVRELNRKRDTLRDQKFDIERVQPLRAQGSQGINDLVLANLAASDPYFEKYEQELRALINPSIKQGQVLTLTIAKEALALVKGRHMTEILAEEKEAEIRREKNKTDANMPSSTSGRTIATQPKSPDNIRDRFGDRADEAFRAKKNKGMDENTFAQKLGYKDKAEWFKKDDELSQDSNRSFGLDR